jgi:uncharacterized protein YhjY with autotransporter beta-barrel domain
MFFGTVAPSRTTAGGDQRRRSGLLARLGWLVLSLLLTAPVLAATTVSLERVGDWTDEARTVASGRPTLLAVRTMADGQGIPGREVRWSVSPSGDASLSRTRSLGSAGGSDSRPIGESGIAFSAKRSGEYVVTARTQSNPGCSGADCETWAEVHFHLRVQAASSDSGDASNGMWPVLAGAGAAVALIASNRGDDEAKIRSLSKVSGDNQSAPFNTALASPLVVRASNDNQAKKNVSITWSATGGATLSATSSSTNENGLAQVNVSNVGPGPAAVTVTATRSDSGESVSFNVIVLNPSLVMVSGNGQSAPTSTQVPSPLVVEARIGSSPQSGVGITWAVISGDASIASVSNGGNTNGAGQSSAVIDFGPTPGPVSVKATRNDTPTLSQTFSLVSTFTRSLALVSGNNQTAAPNAPLASPLVVHATDNGADAAGVTINWSASGGATLGSATSVTDGTGQASINVTSTGPGPQPFTVTATRSDDPSAIVYFSENILPPDLSIVAGDGQDGLTGSVAEVPLEVLLVDGASAPVSGATISWSVIGGSAMLNSSSSVTDSAGHTTMGFTYGSFPGTVTIQASAYGGLQTVTFTVTALTASGLTKGGDGQSGNPGDTLAPFVVTIVPPAGATDLSGVPVTFAITSGTGTLSVTSTVTDSFGQANTQLTLGLTPGTVTVVAQVSGGPSTTFTATINGTLVGTSLSVVSGDGQTLSTGQASSPMVVELTDAGTPLSGLTLTWSTNNGSVTPTSSVTDANGRASATVTPSASGPVLVTVNFAAYAQYTASSTSFSHNTTLSSVPGLTTDQSAVAVALDSACSELSSGGPLTSEEQDLLDQCEALADASDSDPSAVAEAIDEMLPDVALTQTQTGEAAVDAQFDNINGRMINLRAGAGNSFGGLTLSAPTGSVSLGSLFNALLAEESTADKQDASGFSRWAFFVSGNIGRGSTDANANAPRYDFDIRGLTAGVDYRKSDHLVLGVALGYSNQDSTLAGGQGSLKMQGYSLSGYLTWYHENDWYLDGVLSLGRNSYEHRRRVVYVLPTETVDQIARASSDGMDTSASLTLGRDFNRQAWNFGVYGRAQFSRQRFDGYEERLDSTLPGSGLALRIDDRSVNSLSSVLGFKASYVHSAGWGVLMPLFGVEWLRDYSGDPDTFRAFLISDPTGTPILITGEALDSNYFRANFGLSMVFTRGRSGFIQYDRIFGRDGNSQENLTLGLRVEF